MSELTPYPTGARLIYWPQIMYALWVLLWTFSGDTCHKREGTPEQLAKCHKTLKAAYCLPAPSLDTPTKWCLEYVNWLAGQTRYRYSRQKWVGRVTVPHGSQYLPASLSCSHFHMAWVFVSCLKLLSKWWRKQAGNCIGFDALYLKLEYANDFSSLSLLHFNEKDWNAIAIYATSWIKLIFQCKSYVYG